MKLRRNLSLLCAGMMLGAIGLFLMRGPLNDNDCLNSPLAKGCN